MLFLVKFWGNIQKYAIQIAIVLALLIGVYFYGRNDGKAAMELKYEKEKAEWISTVNTTQALLDQSTADLLKPFIIKQTEYKYITKMIEGPTTIVTEYVNKDADSRCVVPVGFVDLHNKAAEGLTFDKLKDIPTNYGVDSGVKLSEVAQTTSINYTKYNEVKEQLETLQNVVREFQVKQEALVN
jgi:hypothetical protein